VDVEYRLVCSCLVATVSSGDAGARFVIVPAQ
jgi:hypothetical protein